MSGFNDYRLPSLDALLAFEAAAQMESFDRAAESLSVTSSALRKRISGLEQLLGVLLFNRLGGTVTLTAQGQAYLEQITPILEQLVAIPMHSRLTQRKQRLTICCPPTFARQILIPRLPEHSAAHPNIDLQIQLSAPLVRSIGGTWDINISGDSAKVEPEHRLLDEQLQPLAAPDLLTRFGSLHLLDDISRLPLLRSPLEPWRPWFNEAQLDLPEPHVGPVLLDLGMMLETAANGQGVVLARPSLARSWLADGRLVPLGKIRSKPSFHYEVSVLQPSVAADAFVAWLKQICCEAVSSAQMQLEHSL
ncbi:LysR family transcriptional regulator, glycine cleavage system transcriptional activator [Pseudomonas sp. IT-P44]|jgi:DNA-binding transcriptional LysR family regulator|uniref:LysR substrate-binding domain-containing protein n=1 Tax=Pseudomonas sp. IT-P44 TaxID=3026451 RepID=UPI0039E0703D